MNNVYNIYPLRNLIKKKKTKNHLKKNASKATNYNDDQLNWALNEFFNSLNEFQIIIASVYCYCCRIKWLNLLSVLIIKKLCWVTDSRWLKVLKGYRDFFLEKPVSTVIYINNVLSTFFSEKYLVFYGKRIQTKL